MSLPPPPPSETGTVRKRLGSVTPTNSDTPSPERTPVQSNLTTPTYNTPSPTFYHQQSSTLPTNQIGGFVARSGGLVKEVGVNGTATSATLPYPGNVAANRSGLQSLNLQHVNNPSEPQSPKKLAKKISFNLAPQETPALPKKPPPPKRSDSTRLSSPRKLTDPPTEFLKDLQRVMRKKWQVAQKCKEEPSTTPYEVLGFRDPPVMLPDYKETNVSNWVKEHYGPNNFYENVYRDSHDTVVEYATSPVHNQRGNDNNKIYDFIRCKRPPPPPPKRSELTHLSTTTKTH